MSHTYFMDDCRIAVPEGFRDRSINLLEWEVDGDKIALVVQRELLPAAAGKLPAREALDRYAAVQTKDYPTRFSGYALDKEERASEAGIELCRMMFRWKLEENVLYHHQVFALIGGGVLLLTGSAKASHRGAVDEIVGGAIAELRVRED